MATTDKGGLKIKNLTAGKQVAAESGQEVKGFLPAC